MKTAPKRVLKISAKCSDLFFATLIEDGKKVGEYDGYVPNFMPEDHYGDYVNLNIDVDTGQILNWETPTEAQLQSVFK